MTKETSDSEKNSALSAFQRATLWILALVLVGSVAARAVLARNAPAPSGAPGQAGSSFTAQAERSGAKDGAFAFEDLLPFATEASLFALIGFALGFTTRRLFKLLLILIALAFVIVQGLAYAGWIEVDWGVVQQRINEWVLNLKRDQTVTKILTYRLPSLGALGAGWLVGLRRT